MNLEFALPQVQLSAILPHIVLTVAALAVLLLDVLGKEKTKHSLGPVALVGVIVAAITLLMPAWEAQTTAFSGMLFTDGFAFFFTLTVCIILFLTILTSMSYQSSFANINCGEYYCLVLFAGLGMTFMVAAANLILLFVALELMSISIYVLTGFHRNKLRSIEAALKYFLMGAFASAFLLFGFAFLYGATGTLDITAMTSYLASNPDIITSGLFLSGLLLTLTGMGFKISMVPFHMWTPDVYEGAPTVITGFMATGVKAAAFAALIRVIMVPVSTLSVDWTLVFWIASALTMTVGNIIALVQDDVKRMLAYSGIAHAGYLLIGVVAGSELAQAGMLYYLLAYAFMNLGAFGVLTLLNAKNEEYSSLTDMPGLGLAHPVMGLVMAVFMFSLAGIPPTAGFMGKLYIFSAAIKSGAIWLVLIGAANSVISIYYYLRVIVVMYFHQPSAQPTTTPVATPAISLALLLATVGVLIMGIFPSFFWTLAQNSVFLPL